MSQPTTSANALLDVVPETSTDDGSSHLHRQLIGILGGLLPVVVWMVSGMRYGTSTTPWALLPSVSHYYYTGAVAAFVGMLVALGLVLLTYGGYRNAEGRWDRFVGRIAGTAAVIVAAFPTDPLTVDGRTDWWQDWHTTVHLTAAAVLFACFAVFSLFLFRMGDPKGDRSKIIRNRIFLICGIVIVGGLGWTAWTSHHDGPIFVPETVMLLAFATSWLVKGRIDVTLAAIWHNLRKHPVSSAKAVADTMLGKR